MKAIRNIAILVFFFSHLGNAQIPDSGTYVINNTFGAFHGTWVWANGNDTVKIYLTTKKVHIDDYDVDLLCGCHIYKRGNVVIESSYGNLNINNTQTINLWNDLTYNNPKVEGTIRDLSKSNKLNFLFLTINQAQNQLTWRCTERGWHIYSSNQVIPPSGITLPRNMVLIKQ